MRVKPFLDMEGILSIFGDGTRPGRCGKERPAIDFAHSVSSRRLRVEGADSRCGSPTHFGRKTMWICQEVCVATGGARVGKERARWEPARCASADCGTAYTGRGGTGRITLTASGAGLLTSLQRAQPDSRGTAGAPDSASCAGGSTQHGRRACMRGESDSRACCASSARWVAQIPGINARPDAMR